MFLGIFSAVIILIALAICFAGARMLFGLSWIIGWLRGTFGFAFLALSVVVALAAWDLFSYEQVLRNQPIATISLDQLDDQLYNVKFSVLRENSEESFEIRGDQWQIDARMITWNNFLLALGAKPSYRLDRIAGRYYSLEDERRKERTVHELAKSEMIDTWSWVRNYGQFFPVMKATYGSATYLPMADGAIYEIALSSSGLVATPINSVAQEAIQSWQ